MFTCFDRIHQRDRHPDGQTDGRTDGMDRRRTTAEGALVYSIARQFKQLVRQFMSLSMAQMTSDIDVGTVGFMYTECSLTVKQWFILRSYGNVLMFSPSSSVI